MIILFLKGCLIGFSIAMPVGPIGLLCIRNALTRGMRFGLMTGLGAASADAIFGALAGFGVTVIGAFMTDFQMYLHMVGALFLAYLGIATFKEKPLDVEISNQAGGLSYAFISTFFLTLINPMTILSFAGIYAGLSSSFFSSDWIVPIVLTIGIFIGSAIWWLLLSIAASHLKEKMNVKARAWLNRISGMMILGFGAASVFKMLSV
jgi:threonine/homoserine/homoserine lactone efflux protein